VYRLADPIQFTHSTLYAPRQPSAIQNKRANQLSGFYLCKKPCRICFLKAPSLRFVCYAIRSINMNFARLKKHVVSARMTAGNQLITNQQNKKSPSHKGHWNANSIKMQRARVQEVRAVHRAI